MLLALALDEVGDGVDAEVSGDSLDAWLAAAGAREGIPEKISHRELSRHLVDGLAEVLYRTTIRPTVRVQQLVILLVIPFLLLPPVMFFRGAHFLHDRWRESGKKGGPEGPNRIASEV